MRILAIDTTTEFGSLALHEGGETLEEAPLRAPDGFSQVLFGYIDALLRRHDWSLESVDVFAAAAGPGSFTGVRVGLTAAKGLADAMGRGALAVSNLKALAECGSGAGCRGVVMDARRGEIYGAVYDAELNVVSPEVVAPFPGWLAGLAVPLDEIIAPDFSAFRASFPLDIPVREQRTLAAAIARIAERSQSSLDPALLDANYVRRSDAELFWKDRSDATILSP
jgi:tRNA threonylcarbamoyladenosine biosynthesis protein TsaB